jgi:hypothetical protein
VPGSNGAPVFPHLAMKLSFDLASHGDANVSQHEYMNIFSKRQRVNFEADFSRSQHLANRQ